MLTKKKPTVATILDTRRLTTTGKNAGKYSIKTRVTFIVVVKRKTQWLRKYYPTGYYATEDEFEVITGKNTPRDQSLSLIRLKIRQIEAKAIEIVDELNIHDQATFEVHFLSSGSIQEIDGMFNLKITELEANNKISTAEKYRTALTVIHKFAGDYVTYGEITSKWLNKFKNWYEFKKNKRGEIVSRSMASFAFHARALRHIFRMAIASKIIQSDLYPFGQFQIPSVRRALKRYLTPEEKDKILSYKTSWHKDLWVFSYYCQGLNFADIANLKRRDVHNDHILIIRHKTKNTDHEQKHKILFIFTQNGGLYFYN